MTVVRVVCFFVGGALALFWGEEIVIAGVTAPSSTQAGSAAVYFTPPPAPATLPPLVLPKRDIFAADHAQTTHASMMGVGGPYGNPTVPAVGVGSGRGLIGTVVGNESYALYDDGTTVRVLHIGDAVGKLTVVAVDADGVKFSDGSRAGLVSTSPSNVIAPHAPMAVMNDPAAFAPPSVGNAPALAAPSGGGTAPSGGMRTMVVGPNVGGAAADASAGPRTYVVAPAPQALASSGPAGVSIFSPGGLSGSGISASGGINTGSGMSTPQTGISGISQIFSGGITSGVSGTAGTASSPQLGLPGANVQGLGLPAGGQ